MYKIGIIILILTGIIMAQAKFPYKKKSFDSFGDGLGFEYVTEKNAAKQSTNIKINEQNGKLTLGNDLGTISLPAPVDQLSAQDSHLVLSDRFLVQGYDNTGLVTKVYKCTDGSTLTLVKTLSLSFGFTGGMIGAGKLAVMFSADTTNLFAYSIDSGANWTETTQSVFTAYRAGNILLKDYIYFSAVLTSGKTGILRTQDGQTFEAVYESPATWLDITYLVEENGFIYFEMGDAVYRLENNTAKLIQKFSKEENIQLYGNGNLYIFSTKGSGASNPTRIKLYEFDGTSFIVKKDFIFPAQIQTQGPGTRDLSNAYILCGIVNGNYAGFTGNVTFRIDGDGNLHLVNAFDYNNEEVWEVFIFNNTLYYIDGGSVAPGLLYGNNYVLAGSIETPALNDGEIVPKQLILRHKPLTANTSLKVYVKKDFASAWTLLLTSNTVGAIKKKYTFANGYGVADFMEFKIELITTSATDSPEFSSLDFVYVPIGIENK